MPTYVFQCTQCNFLFEEILSIKNMDQPLSSNCPSCKKKKLQRIITTITIGDPVRLGIRKIDPRLKENLERIKKHHPGSTIKV